MGRQTQPERENIVISARTRLHVDQDELMHRKEGILAEKKAAEQKANEYYNRREAAAKSRLLTPIGLKKGRRKSSALRPI